MPATLLFVEPESDMSLWAESCVNAGVEGLLLTSKTVAPGHPVANTLHLSEIDVEGIVEAARRCHARGLWSDAPELQLTVLEAAERLCLPRAQAAASPGLLHLLDTHGDKPSLPLNRLHLTPELATAERTAKRLGMPLWMRAFGATGRSYCRLVEHEPDLPLAFESARRRFEGGLLALQEPAEAPCYRVIGFKLQRDFLAVELIAERFVRGAFRVACAWSLPAGLGGGEYAEVLALAAKAAALLPPSCGYVEFEILLDAGRPLLNNLLMPPAPAPLIAQLVRLGLGIDLCAQCWRVALGQPPDLSPKRALAVSACYLSARSGVVEEIRGVEAALALPGAAHIDLRARPGDTLGHIVDEASREKVGCAIAAGATRETAEQRLLRICETLEIVTSPML